MKKIIVRPDGTGTIIEIDDDKTNTESDKEDS